MFPIMTFWLVLVFAAAWIIFAFVYWTDIPARTGGVLFAVTLAVLGFSLNTPDCQTWSCDAPPETMTAPQHQLTRQRSVKENQRVIGRERDKADIALTTKHLDRIARHADCMVKQEGGCHHILEEAP